MPRDSRPGKSPRVASNDSDAAPSASPAPRRRAARPRAVDSTPPVDPAGQALVESELGGSIEVATWEAVQRVLPSLMPGFAQHVALRSIHLVQAGPGWIRLGLPNAFARNWVFQCYRATLDPLLAETAGRPVAVEYVVHVQGDDAEAVPEAPAAGVPLPSLPVRGQSRAAMPEAARSVRLPAPPASASPAVTGPPPASRSSSRKVAPAVPQGRDKGSASSFVDRIPSAGPRPSPAPDVQARPHARSAPAVEPLAGGEPSVPQRLPGGFLGTHTLSQLMVGAGNRIAVEAARRLIEDPSGPLNPLVIVGGIGTGKTHLLQAVGQELLRRSPRSSVRYITGEAFTNDYINAGREKKFSEFRKKWRSSEVLLVDDLQFVAGKKGTTDELLHTLQALQQAGCPVIVSLDTAPPNVIGLDPRLQNRLMGGMVVELHDADRSTRRAIALQQGRRQGILLPDDVVDFLADWIRGGARAITGAVTRIISSAQLLGTPLTVESCRELLGSYSTVLTPQATVEVILRAVVERFSVSLDDLKGVSRRRPIARARQAAMFLCRKLTDLSYPDIGRVFGGRDHSTVITAVRRAPALAVQEESFGRLMESVGHALGVARQNLLTPVSVPRPAPRRRSAS